MDGTVSDQAEVSRRSKVYEVVYALLDEGGWTHQAIADEVKRRCPGAATTAKSVASHAVAWRRQRKAAELKLSSRQTQSREAKPPLIEDAPVDPAALAELVVRAKLLAADYYRVTGRPLGVTGEIGEFEAARLLGHTLAPPRAAGYDLIGADGLLYQVKTRCYGRDAKPGQRLGGVKLTHPWHKVLLVLLNPELDPTEIWEADREPLAAALSAPGSKSRNERGALAVSKFKQIGRQVWPNQTSLFRSP